MKKRLKAFMLANTILALVAISVCAFSLMLTIPSMFGALEAEDLSLRAMQYAEVDAKIVKLLNYDDLSDDDVLIAAKLHTDRAEIETINADGWEDELIIGPEQVMGDGENLYRIATVNIYRTGDTVPRATLEVPLSSQDAGKVSLNSTIIIGQTYGSNYLPVPDTWDKSKTLAFVSLAEIHHLHKDSEFATVCYVDSNFYVTAYTYQYDGGWVRQQKVNYLLIYLG